MEVDFYIHELFGTIFIQCALDGYIQVLNSLIYSADVYIHVLYAN
jgi:hypothetical protein